MPTLTVDTIEAERVTFVEVVIEAERPHRIRLEPAFDGTIWPPRIDGEPLGGWDDTGVTTRIAAGRTPVGFATPVRPTPPAVELVYAEPCTDGVPDGMAGWIDRIEDRLETAERIERADCLASATESMAAVGGVSGVETLAAEIARDRRLAARLSIVPDDLSERLDAIDVPATTLARIARSSEPPSAVAPPHPPPER
ncbi:MAG: hypothetical protein RI568_08485 [Natronomonas sp.]|jgi:hypothetical protein|uniref:DUF7857 domain-containing protein n=1 Tax=Natronomonas sp. TaxID=2184060 RepID=UPI00286FEDEC|nr:hypothetical protein [Natronomonas sp.]MDR9430718.1 hypothetical protein [Natronomonas sp.]